jgi:hypothetical protein
MKGKKGRRILPTALIYCCAKKGKTMEEALPFCHGFRSIRSFRRATDPFPWQPAD